MTKKEIFRKAKIDSKGRCNNKAMKKCNCPTAKTQCCTRKIERIMNAINELEKWDREKKRPSIEIAE